MEPILYSGLSVAFHESVTGHLFSVCWLLSVDYHSKGDFQRVTDMPHNLIDMHRVAFSHFRQFLSYSVQSLVPIDALFLP